MIRPFDVYLFDLDGTLLDSAQDICAAVQHVLSGHVSEPLPFDYLKSFVGFHLDDVFTDVLPDATREQLDGMIELYKKTYLARRHTSTRLVPGVVEGLESLGGRKSTATTKGTPTTRAVLEQFGLLRYFDHVQGTDGFPCKPAPDVLLRAIEALGARPEDCIFVGDSEADMEAGRRAGVRICAVDYGYGKAGDLAKWNPDYRISDLRELSPGMSYCAERSGAGSAQ
ncbi:MAG TPA: HAD-IA family hydrolase [Bryobacteraceae bacterium]|nr:HAD-IA family hydrolase [Bryobacteraceae bacterium]